MPAPVIRCENKRDGVKPVQAVLATDRLVQHQILQFWSAAKVDDRPWYKVDRAIEDSIERLYIDPHGTWLVTMMVMAA